ncbi:hypothetical protein MRX96_017808 [Rhipicephalus microplus]
MPSHVVEELCTHLQEVSTQDLQSLDQDNVYWLPLDAWAHGRCCASEPPRSTSMSMSLLDSWRMHCNHQFHTTFSALQHRDMIFVCMINDYANSGFQEGTAVLLVLWHGQRFAAVQMTPRGKLTQELQRSVKPCMRSEDIDAVHEIPHL